MKIHAVEGELLFGGNVKIVFGGHPLKTSVFVGEGDDWQRLRYCRGFNLEARNGEMELTIDVDNVEGQMVAEQEPLDK